MKTVKIATVRSYMKGERKMICINGSIHLSEKQLAASGVTNPQSLVGNNIKVDFYKKGEKLLNDAECTKDEVIVKSFEVEQTEQDIKLAKAANAGFKVFSL